MQRRTTCVNSFTRGSGSDFVLVVVVRFSFVGSLLTIATAVPLFDTAPCQLLTIVNQHHQLIDDGRGKKKKSRSNGRRASFQQENEALCLFLTLRLHFTHAAAATGVLLLLDESNRSQQKRFRQ